jgi:hypothetical protein
VLPITIGALSMNGLMFSATPHLSVLARISTIPNKRRSRPTGAAAFRLFGTDYLLA